MTAGRQLQHVSCRVAGQWRREGCMKLRPAWRSGANAALMLTPADFEDSDAEGDAQQEGAQVRVASEESDVSQESDASG